MGSHHGLWATFYQLQCNILEGGKGASGAALKVAPRTFPVLQTWWGSAFWIPMGRFANGACLQVSLHDTTTSTCSSDSFWLRRPATSWPSMRTALVVNLLDGEGIWQSTACPFQKDFGIPTGSSPCDAWVIPALPCETRPEFRCL